MMRRIRFLLFSLLGLLTALATYLFTPGQWLHRMVALALCGVLTADQVCLPQEPAASGGSAVAAVPGSLSGVDPQLAAVWETWLAQRSREFDDAPTSPTPAGNPTAPPFPYDPGPNQPLRRPDFDESPVADPQPRTPQNQRFGNSGSSETCQPILLSRSAKPAGELIIQGIPEDFIELNASVKVRDMAQSFDLITRRFEDGNIGIGVPLHPQNGVNGGSIDLYISSGDQTCPTVTFDIESLPVAPSNTLQTTSLKLQEFVDKFIETSGVSRSQLTNFSDFDEELLPLQLAQWLLNGSDNPNSLAAVLAGTAPILEGETVNPDIVMSIIAASGLNQVLDDVIAILPRSQSSDDLVNYWTMKSKSLMMEFKFNKKDKYAFTDVISCAPSRVSNAQQLSDCMLKQESWNQTKEDKAVKSLTFVISNIISIVNLFSNIFPALKLGSVVGTIGMIVVGELLNAQVNLLPSKLTHLYFTATKNPIKIDEVGTWNNIVIYAESETWQLTPSLFFDFFTLTLGLGSDATGFERSAIGVVVDTIAGYINSVLGYIGPDQKGLPLIGPRKYQARVEDKHNEVTPTVNPQSILALNVGTDTYQGQEEGRADLILSVRGFMFNGKTPPVNCRVNPQQSCVTIAVGDQEEEDERKEPKKRSGDRKTGTSYGDPHIITFDGFRYSFQTVGEFTLVQATDGSFEVQTRQSAVPGRDLSLNTGVAIRAGSDRIAVYSKFFPDSDTNNPLRVNGRPVTIQGGSLTLPGGAVIYQQGQHDYLVEVPTGEQVAIKSIRMGASEYMNVTPAVFSGSPGLYTGLLGDMDGNPGNDLRGRDGNVIPSRSTYGEIKNIATRIIPIPGVIPLGTIENAVFDQLYKQFGNSWRISAANSLFDYAPGQSTETFTDRSFPRQYRTLNQLSPQQIEQAERTCLEAGVEPDLLEGCIFDVGFTGEAGFAQSAANAMNLINQFNRIIPGGIPIPRPPIGIPGLPF